MDEDISLTLEHVSYEWWVFQATRNVLKSLQTTERDGHDPVRNALVESMVLHGRVLAEFFLNKARRPDDLTLTKMGIDATTLLTERERETLKSWSNQADKHAAHLTEKRASSVVWDSDSMHSVLATATEALSQKLPLLRLHDREGVVHGEGRDVWLRTKDGVRIYARYYERGAELPTLLYLHGGGGTVASRSDRLALFSSLGANLLALEYRGYGLSEGASSEPGLMRDAAAAYDWLGQRTDANKIVPFGESLGGGPATWLAMSRPVGGLILLSTSTSVPALAGHFMPWLPTRLLVRTRFDNGSRIKQVAAPKLFIHSRSDEIVPFAMGESLWRSAPEPKRKLWLDGVGHNETFYKARAEGTEAMRDFLSSLACCSVRPRI